MKCKDFMKYPKIKYLDADESKDLLINPEDEIIIEEKVDGANFRFMYHNGKFIFGSRNKELGEPSIDNKAWSKAINYIKENFTTPLTPNLLNNYIYYGECMTPHSTTYDYMTTPPFIGFDIYHTKKHKFINVDTTKGLVESSGLPFIPILKRIKAKDFKEPTDADIPQSKYGNIQAEGIVFKNYNTQTFVKHVTEKHREVSKQIFGGSPKWQTTYHDKITAKYCTNARIEKAIFNLISEGHELNMALMKHLPMTVYWDIIDEESHSILKGNEVLDIGKFRKAVAKRCLNALKHMIYINASHEKN